MPESTQDKALRLLRATGGTQQAEFIYETLVSTLRPALKTMPDSFWQKMKRRFDPEHLMRTMAARHAEAVEILDDALAFFESSSGRRYIELGPTLMKINIEVGRQWGERVGADIANETS